MQSFYSRSKVFTLDPELLLLIQSFYFGSKVTTPIENKLRSNPIQFANNGVWTRDIQFTIQHGSGCCRRFPVPQDSFNSQCVSILTIHVN